MADYKPCSEWMELLVARDEDLSSREREALKAHLADCSQYAAAYERYQQMVLRLRILPPVEPLSGFTPQLIQAERKIETDPGHPLLMLLLIVALKTHPAGASGSSPSSRSSRIPLVVLQQKL